MRTLFFCGDAACESGFARATHHTLPAFLKRHYRVVVLGLNYRGDPDARRNYPYDIYPCWPGGDAFGVKRIKALVEKEKPSVVVIQNDPWNFPAYTKQLEMVNGLPVPTVGAVAVDGKNCRGQALNKLTRALFWTEFAQQEAIAGGMRVPSGVVPLGVDLDLYSPGDRLAAREAVGLPEDVKKGFIFGNMNRNQPRKRLDLTISAFGKWLKASKVEDAYLYLHIAPTGDLGYNCEALARYHGFNSTAETSRLILAEPEMFHGTPESRVVQTLRTFDVQISTTLGEGWGLTTMEGMACGIPQIVPDYSALGEWARSGALLVPCTGSEANPASVIGGVVDEPMLIEAMDAMYSSATLRAQYRERGLALVAQPQFRWEHIADAFAEEVELTCPPERD